MSDYLELYERIRDDAAPVSVELNGKQYATCDLKPVHAPKPEPLRVGTLSAVADYLNQGIDAPQRGALFVRVDSPISVQVQSHLVGDFCDRGLFVWAQPMLPDCLQGYEGKWLEMDYFQILLQAGFAGACKWEEGLPLNGKAAVLRYISRIQCKATATVSDDGTAQAVVLSAGIGSTAVSKLPNPVRLAPYRTFPEVEQPESDFVFRIKEEGEGKIRYSLTEADGGAWRIEAVKRVAEWLKEHIKPELQIPVLY